MNKASNHVGRRCLLLVTLALAAGVLTACGSDSAAGSDPASSGTQAVVAQASVVIKPAGLVMAQGATAQLSAEVKDAAGQVVSGAAVTWRSNSGNVTIDAGGHVNAVGGVSSAQVFAEWGTARSTPVTVMIVKPAVGARLLQDAEILVAPTLTESAPTGLPGSLLRATVAAPAPTVGQVLIGAGNTPLAGRVTAVQAAASGYQVDMVSVGLADAFDQLSLHQNFGSDSLGMTYPHGAPDSTTTQADGTVHRRFTLSIPNTVPQATRRAQAAGVTAKTSFKAGPFSCDANAAAVPTLNASALQADLSNTLAVQTDIQVNAGQVHAKVLATGDVQLALTGSVKLADQLSGSLGCSATLATVVVPVPPTVAALIIPVIPVGTSFGATGTLKSPAVELVVTSTLKQPLTAGFELLPDGSFNNLSVLDTSQLASSFNWDIKADPSQPGFSVDATAQAGLFANVAVTNPLVQVAAALGGFDPNLTLLNGFAGFETILRLAPVSTQVATGGSHSLYNLNFLASLAPSGDVNKALKLLGSLVGAAKLDGTSARWEPTLFAQPTGGGITSLTAYSAGDKVSFRVQLNEPSTHAEFMGQTLVPYNVKAVEVWRRKSDGSADRLSTVDAIAGQIEFKLDWTADESDKTLANGTERFFAVVVPVFGNSFSMVMDSVHGWSGIKQQGINLDDQAMGVDFDADGRVYVTQYTYATIGHLGSNGQQVPLPKPGGLDAAVVKYSPAGGALDAVMIGSGGDDAPVASRTSADGFLYVAGNTTGGSVTGVGSNASPSSWLAKIDVKTMAVVWVRQLGDVANQAAGLAIAPDGSIYVSGNALPGVAGGSTEGTVFGGITYCADLEAAGSTDCADLMLSKFSPDGSLLWSVVDPHPGMQTNARVTVTPDGRAVLVANTRCDVKGSLSQCDANEEIVCDQHNGKFATCPANANPADKRKVHHLMAALWVYGPDGTGGPVRNFKYDGCEIGTSTPATDAAGNPTFTGVTTCTASPFSDNPGGWAFIVMQTDLSGATQWARSWNFGDTSASSLTPDFSGGFGYGTLPFNTLGNTALNGIVRGSAGEFYVTYTTAVNGNPDAVVMRMDNSGGVTWERQFGSAGAEYAKSVSVDPFGNVFAAGSTTGALDSSLPAGYGGKDVYVVKLSPSAVIQSVVHRSASKR